MDLPEELRNHPLVVAVVGVSIGVITAWAIADRVLVQPRDFEIEQLSRQLDELRLQAELPGELVVGTKLSPSELAFKKPVEHRISLHETWLSPDGHITFTLKQVLPGTGGPKIVLGVGGAEGWPLEPISQGGRFDLSVTKPVYRVSILSIDYDNSAAIISIKPFQ